MNLGKERRGDILHKEKLKFKSNKELEEYYEKKYREGGYKKGYMLWGINYSNIYHKGRHNTSFELLNPQKDETILDAGCGPGQLTLRIAKKAKRAVGIDISKNAFAKAKSKAPKNVEFLKMNVENIKFKKDTFDKIVSVETLEHLLNPQKALKEMHRVLKPKGILILTYPTIDQTIMQKIQKFLMISEPFPVSEHLTEWDYGTLIKNVEKRGFEFIEAKGVVFDFGKIAKLEKLSKAIAKFHIKVSMAITNFPRNSLFVAAMFRKK